MTSWLRGKRAGALGFLLITLLVIGGLAWVTVQALAVEREQQGQTKALASAEHERLAEKARAESERAAARVRAERERELDNRLRLALSLLDSRVLPALVQEDNRPYNHYSALYASPLALVHVANTWKANTVLEPSPLLSADIPDWFLLHFQTDDEAHWGSPQILSPSLRQRLAEMGIVPLALPAERLQARTQLFEELHQQLSPKDLLALFKKKGGRLQWAESTLVPSQIANSADNKNSVQVQGMLKKADAAPIGSYGNRASQYQRVQSEANAVNAQKLDANLIARNIPRNGEDWLTRGAGQPAPGETVSIIRGPMLRFWLRTAANDERLIVARLVHAGKRTIYQGIVLDWPRLQNVLAEEVSDLFPQARFLPMREDTPPHPERTMTALPIVLDPGPLASEPPEAPVAGFLDSSGEPSLVLSAVAWTPLRVGLGMAWLAALIALLAVGLGGWSLLDLSERRIRFVSAVTHELRTPLTTLRLYLDMLTGGVIQDEQQKEEYLQTLHGEAERLNRLIANVLDFSRLEKQRPQLHQTTVPLADLLKDICRTWEPRCRETEKELVLDNRLESNALLVTDIELLHQILGNLIDNACKYSRGAEDRLICLRAYQDSPRSLTFEVEDRGPGIPPHERQAILRPFHRGRDADVTAGGVGLGLALVQRWVELLGGRLTVHAGAQGIGACFRVQLPQN